MQKLQDIRILVQEIIEARAFDGNTTCETFAGYKDPLARIDMAEFHKWVNEQKKVAAVKMVINAKM